MALFLSYAKWSSARDFLPYVDFLQPIAAEQQPLHKISCPLAPSLTQAQETRARGYGIPRVMTSQTPCLWQPACAPVWRLARGNGVLAAISHMSYESGEGCEFSQLIISPRGSGE